MLSSLLLAGGLTLSAFAAEPPLDINAPVAPVAPEPLKFGAYYVNWAQYRQKPYTYTAESLKNLIPITDRLMYSFVYFCPPAGTSPMPYWAVKPFGNCTDATEYSMMYVETNDAAMMKNVTTLRKANPDMKVIASIGGWNFPSAYWSKMSSTSASRAKFVTSAAAFLKQEGFDGIDIDWEFPTSGARDNAVKITCDQFRTVHDAGGTKDDSANIVDFFHDLRGGLPNAEISFAAPANVDNAKLSNCTQVANYLDFFHIMSYDYTVSDVPGGDVFNPNSPLYNPPAPAMQMSIDYSVQGYLNMGIKPSQLKIGVAYYGHTWFNPNLNESQWQSWGQKLGTVQGECCGPFKQTMGGQPGKGSGQCGSLMYSEIVAAGFDTWYDNVTKSDIGYLSKDSGDSYTKKGMWVTFNSPKSLKAVAEYAKKWKLAGVFCYDSSMDTLDYKALNYTYELSNMIVATLRNVSNNTLVVPEATF